MQRRFLTIGRWGGFAILTATAVWYGVHAINGRTPEPASTTVVRGEVTETVAVSGFTEAKNVAELGFPQNGIVTDIFIEEGAEVKAGDLIATLGASRLVAERAVATAALEKARAEHAELLSGPTDATRSVLDAKVTAAQSAYETAVATEAAKVANAHAALLSNDLAARTTDVNEDAPAPQVSGSYQCEAEGSYTISVYRANSDTGYAYSVTGLETDNQPAVIDQPGAFGICGLYLQFAAGGKYDKSTWIIDVPNSQSSTYTTYKNAYELALKQQTQVIDSAREAYELAAKETGERIASPRSESITRTQAAIDSAYASIAAIDAQIADLSIITPFSGVVTDISISRGEVVSTTPVITILGEGAYTLTARIPEIDVTKILPDQEVLVRFDANVTEPIQGSVSFISPLPTSIDGVAYFEATIILSDTPSWLRAGLNADVDIITRESAAALKIPTRYLFDDNGIRSVLLAQHNGKLPIPTPVNVIFTGNDGFAAVEGLNEGDVIIAPEL